ncbi:MAG: DUF2339 domain-containing protein [Candidatus Riflebacteria bacterium]|nr:DUF2339 domain-containing protein [Candidatus Riflebacteria bacterium]
MLELMLLVLFGYFVFGRISSNRKVLEEKVEELENSVHFLNDKVNALKKLIDKQRQGTEPKHPESSTAKVSPARYESEKKRNKVPFGKPEEPIDTGTDFASLSFSQKGKDVSQEPDITAETLKAEKPAEASEKNVDKTAAGPEVTEKRPDEEPLSLRPEDAKFEWLKRNRDALKDETVTVQEFTADEIESTPSKTSSQGKKSSAETSAQAGDPGGPSDPGGPHEPDWGDSWRKFKAGVDWEQFTGAMLFAWLGGIALFIGAGFFVKYSIDKNLISPVMRLVIGAIVGLAMIAGSFRFERGRYDTMRHTLAAGGIGVLYSVFFAATLYYGYFEKPLGFVTLVTVSAAAFVLAIFHRGVAISVLGGLGAYLTPLLVSTGRGNLLTLFIYLAIVNVGIYQVIKRLESRFLLLFSTIGTLFSLTCATLLASPTPDAYMIGLAWVGNLFVFAVFLDLLGWTPQTSRSTQWSALILFLSMPLMALFVVASRAGCTPMSMMAATIAIAVALALRKSCWHDLVIPYSALTFLVAGFWALARFNATSNVWSFLAFFVYGLAGGIGPILLIHKNGLDRFSLKWFRVFPVAMSLLMLMAIMITPKMSAMFWPMAIGLQVIGIIISLLFGGLVQLGLMAMILVLAAGFWISYAAPVIYVSGVYALILLAGAAVILVLFWCLKRVGQWSETLKIDKAVGEDSVRSNPLLTEWMSATPIMGIFILLATAFAFVKPLNPNPGMVTLFCFGAITLTMARRMGYSIMIAVTLFSGAFAQATWALRPDLTIGIYSHSILWSVLLLVSALIVPFIVYKDFGKFKTAWMAWPVFELAQAIFIVYAADHIWTREISGWVPVVLAFIKLPFVKILLGQLEGKAERNSVLACHGGVLLFYLSATPILLLEKGWLGLVLVLESVALLWLNRRVEHSGLRKVSMALAPVGLYLLLSFLPQMKGATSMIILNSAVLSVLAATVALFAAVKLAPYPDDKIGEYSISKYFLWLAIGTGFYLVNLVVADVFAGSQVEAGSTLKFLPSGNLLQTIVYVTLWGLFGAVLWRQQTMPTGIRYFGMILLILATLWLIWFPFGYGTYVAAMSPLINLGMLAYVPMMLILLYLFMKEPWQESSISIKNLFLAMLLVAGFLAIKVIKSTVLQPGQPFDIFQAKTAGMAIGSAAGWIIYGLLMLVWPKRLDRPFRLAGLVLLSLGLIRTALFPFRFSEPFGEMTPLFNSPTALFAFCIILLIWLTRRKYDETWPVAQVQPNAFFGTTLAAAVFYVLNIEIASYFGREGRPFSLMTHGSLSHQLGYSLGWLTYAIGLLLVGIKWMVVRARQAALLLVLLTCSKIFLMDLWSLGQLYRVASFIGLAVVLMLVSYLYQRFLTKSE